MSEGIYEVLGSRYNMLTIAEERYEKVRRMNPQQFKELWYRNIAGEGRFDDLVDEVEI